MNKKHLILGALALVLSAVACHDEAPIEQRTIKNIHGQDVPCTEYQWICSTDEQCHLESRVFKKACGIDVETLGE